MNQEIQERRLLPTLLKRKRLRSERLLNLKQTRPPASSTRQVMKCLVGWNRVLCGASPEEVLHLLRHLEELLLPQHRLPPRGIRPRLLLRLAACRC